MADILVVDDDRDLAEILSSVLVGLGHQVQLAHDGRDGLTALDGRLSDLVILDIEMPTLDGPGMAAEMFVINCGRERIPIVLVSGSVDLASTAARVGTPYFAPKPCPLDVLLGLVDRALRERQVPSPPALGASRPRAARAPSAPSAARSAPTAFRRGR